MHNTSFAQDCMCVTQKSFSLLALDGIDFDAKREPNAVRHHSMHERSVQDTRHCLSSSSHLSMAVLAALAGLLAHSFSI